MAEPPHGRLQTSLQAAVQTVQWTYSIFWQLCTQQGSLVWSDGYYNGAIKTRKTVQATEESAEEATLQRSQQLRELYESLSAGESVHQTRRPSASLSPEDLTESEWFYLMCVSFSFPPGVGLPGKAYVERQHIWLTRATEADSNIFSRTILAKVRPISTYLVFLFNKQNTRLKLTHLDLSYFFRICKLNCYTYKSAKMQTVVCIPLLDGVVELGTTERVEEDNGVIQCVRSFFSECQNPNTPPRPALSELSTSNVPAPAFYSPTFLPPQEAEEEEEDEAESEDSDRVLIDPMQLDMCEDEIRVGPPDDSSNNLDSDFHLLAVSHHGNSSHHRAGIMRSWPCQDAIISTTLPLQHSVDGVAEEDSHYSLTVSSILENQSNRWSNFSSSTATSAFSKWFAASSSRHHHNLLLDGAAQRVLKYIIFTVPLLHTKPRDARRSTSQEDLNGNHVLAERRRREKLNERFIILRSMVPFVTKMDKASILADTIEYLNQLKERIQELESTVRQMEADKGRPREKRKMKMKMKMKAKEGDAPPLVEVSIIGSDALVEIKCLNKGGLLFDVMQILGGLGIQVTTVQSSINTASFTAELRAKVRENGNGRRTSIMEVKRALKQIVQQPQ